MGRSVGRIAAPSAFARGSVLAATLVLLACGARTGMRIDEDEARSDAGTRRDAGAPTDAGLPTSFECDREVAISFTPTARTQLAVWAQSIAETDRFATIALTSATAYRGLGNRPGALQLNSGFRWPYGRRENVLPAWASSRLAAGGAPFPRVIFRVRPEGHASAAGAPTDGYRDTRDDYYCLTFNAELTRRDGLDAVTCPSVVNDDKGRYLSEEDVAGGYAEPEESAAGAGAWRALDRASAYPPRMDLVGKPDDHPDTLRYAADARAVMPELDAVTMATPAGDEPITIVWAVPDDWPVGQVVLSVEANTEGDYAPSYDPTSYPTPTLPDGAWDYWAQTYGYPYRGQPSIVFDVEIELPPRDERAPSITVTADRPARRGTLDALPIDDTIVDDPAAHPGSGADRIRRVAGAPRVTIVARQVDCRGP